MAGQPNLDRKATSFSMRAIDEAISRKPKGHDFIINRRHKKPALSRCRALRAVDHPAVYLFKTPTNFMRFPAQHSALLHT
jgi:hypothetical protein